MNPRTSPMQNVSSNILRVFITIASIFYSLSIFSQTVDCVRIKDEKGISYVDSTKTPFTGHCIQYYINGNKEYEGSYTNGIANGEHIWYYKNGQKKEQVTYIINEKDSSSIADGTSTEWFENSKIRKVINYKLGLLDGKWVEYNITGKIIKQGFYKRNKLLRGNKIIMRVV